MKNKNSADKKISSAKKYAFYKNMHPTLETIRSTHPCIDEYWAEDIADTEKTDSEVLEEITEIVAELCMGEEFTADFKNKSDLLPEELYRSFMTDAQKIMEELKKNTFLLNFQDAKKCGKYPDSMPPKAVWTYENKDGSRLIKTFSFLTHIYEEIEYDSTGFIKRIHRQFPNGYCRTHIKEKGKKTRVIVNYAAENQPENTESAAETTTQYMPSDKMTDASALFYLCCMEAVADGEMTEEEMIQDIAELTAEFSLGSQFESDYSHDMAQLPEDMHSRFMQDAKNMLEEIKTNPLLLNFEKEKAKGHFSKQMPSNAVWKQEKPSGEKLIKTYSFINGLYTETEIDSTGFVRRKFFHGCDGSYAAFLYDKNDKDNVQIISNVHSDEKVEENKH